MSCLLCDSSDHLTQYCDKYVTDKERNEYLFSINTCKYCKASYNKYYTYCIQCEPVTKCFTCFSRQHHTFFCPVRSNPPKWFLPKIDKNLFRRFFNTFDPFEQFSFVILIPKAFDFINLRHIEIHKSINLLLYSSRSDCIDVIDDEIYFEGFDSNESSDDSMSSNSLSSSMPPPHTPFEKCFQNISDALTKKVIFFKARVVILENMEIDANNFFQLISNITQVINIYNVKFYFDLAFTQILKKMPIAEEIKIKESNVKAKKTWVEGLQKYGTKLKKLKIPVQNLDFNIKELANVIKTNMFRVSLFWDTSLSEEALYDLLTSEKFSNNFCSLSNELPVAACFLLIYSKMYQFSLTPI